MSRKQELSGIRERMAELKGEAKRIQQAMFEEESQHLFEAFPTLESFGWTQCTPYFNDGDACVFSAQVSYPSINGRGEDEDGNDPTEETIYVEDGVEEVDRPWGKFEQKNYKEVPNPDYNPELAAAKKVIIDFLKQFDNEFFLEAFDDHAEVTVTRTGVTVEEYQHD